MLWYQCLISMNFYLPTKLQRNRRFHTTSVAVRGYRRPRVCHGWRKLCLLVLDTVSLKKIAFICQAWFQKYLSLFWKNTRSFDSGWTNPDFLPWKIGYDWIVGAVSSHLIHISRLIIHGPILEDMFIQPPRLIPVWEQNARDCTSNYPKLVIFGGCLPSVRRSLHLLEQNIFVNIHARWHSLPHGRCSNKIDVLLRSHSVL